MAATVEGSVLQLRGTPTEAGDVSFAVVAGNCNGTEVATELLTLQVSE